MERSILVETGTEHEVAADEADRDYILKYGSDQAENATEAETVVEAGRYRDYGANRDWC